MGSTSTSSSSAFKKEVSAPVVSPEVSKKEEPPAPAAEVPQEAPAQEQPSEPEKPVKKKKGFLK